MAEVQTQGAGQPAAAPPRPRSRKRLLVVVLAIGLAAGAAGGRLWWRTMHYVETDNAYVTGRVHPVSSRIAGVVTKVLVQDNQAVKAADLVIELDPADQRTKVEQILAQIQVVERQVLQSSAQMQQVKAQVRGVQAQVSQARAQLLRAEQDAARYSDLYGTQMKAVSKAEVDAAQAALATAQAELSAKLEAVAAAQAQVVVVESAGQVLTAQLEVLRTQLKEANLQLQYSRIMAPANGWVGKRTVETGMRVQPGQQLAAVVQEEVWVTANFKETQVADLRPGQVAKVTLDGLPGVTLSGRIDSLAPASGAQFALLPPDNATGNFTKIVQRIPVKIVFAAQEVAPLRGRLMPGMSALVAVEKSGGAAGGDTRVALERR